VNWRGVISVKAKKIKKTGSATSVPGEFSEARFL